MTSFNHKDIGLIEGREENGVLQFLSIKYAHLQHAFAEPEMKTDYGSEPLNATQRGPQVISPPDACSGEYLLIQHALPRPEFEISGVDGLHLTITRPSTIDSSTPLPVFVFIHGGGYAVGSSIWPQYDLSRFIRLSMEMAQPVIAVSVNYRLGAPGFLTSKELREAGIKANNGLRDQRTALLWVKKYIAGFGGDPENVTAIGQSAGAGAVMFHLQSEEPLFKQMVNMSGTTLTLPPLPMEVAESVYAAGVKTLKLEGLSAAERVDKILNSSHESLLTTFPFGVLPLGPVVDDDVIVSTPPTLKDVSRDGIKGFMTGDWCKRMMVGSCSLDVSVFSGAIQSRGPELASAFNNCLTKVLSGELNSDEIFEAYKLAPETNDSDALTAIIQFFSDAVYLVPAMAVASAWKSQAFLYLVSLPNPWDGPFKSEASHVLDIALLFQNFNDYLNAEETDVAKNFAQHVIQFINGKDPYPTFEPEQGRGIMTYGPAATSSPACFFAEGKTVGDLARYSRFVGSKEVKTETWDLLLKTWHSFLAGQ